MYFSLLLICTIYIGERGTRGFDGTPGMPGENARPAPKGEKGTNHKICLDTYQYITSGKIYDNNMYFSKKF